MKASKTIIIAEAGVNHNGDLDTARKLIAVAAESGADIVKFQTFSADTIVSKGAEKAEYQKKTTNSGESQYEMIRRLELDRKAHFELMDYCAEKKIEFLSTAYDHKSIDLLHELGLKSFKIPSGEITNLPYLCHIGSYGKPIILSSGMATLEEIEVALRVLERAGTPREKITVLHCNTEYPTPLEDVNLLAMITIRDKLGVKVGYSDHTLGIEVAIAAKALGATVIEKHLTLDRNSPGPDHRASIESGELEKMVKAIRNIEKILGDGIKRPSPSEKKNMTIVRRSIVAARNIKKGEIFTEDNLTVKRPGTGISPMKWNEVLGTHANKDYQDDELIES